jgi:hypothetical protein
VNYKFVVLLTVDTTNIKFQLREDCLNTMGSYMCTCKPGYERLSTNADCTGKICYTFINCIFICCFHFTQHKRITFYLTKKYRLIS